MLFASAWLAYEPKPSLGIAGTERAIESREAQALRENSSSTARHREVEIVAPMLQKGSSLTRSARNGQHYLSFESAILQDSELSFEQAMLALNGKDFDKYMVLITQQSLRLPEAAELSAAYSRSFEEALGKSPALKLRALTCGLSLCAGAIAVSSHADDAHLELWQQTLSLSGTTPAYSMIDVKVQKNGSIEHRFIFSSDPNINGIYGPSLR